MLRTDGDPLLSLALSPDGHTLAVAENDGVVRFFDAATLRPVGRPYDAGKARIPELGYSPDSELEYSPDGTRLAVADVTAAYGGFIDLLDGRTHRRIRRLRQRVSQRGSLALAQGRDVLARLAPPDRAQHERYRGRARPGPPGALGRADGARPQAAERRQATSA